MRKSNNRLRFLTFLFTQWCTDSQFISSRLKYYIFNSTVCNRRSRRVLELGDAPNIPTQLMSPAPHPETHTHTVRGVVHTLDQSPSQGSYQSVLENSCTVKVSVKGILWHLNKIEYVVSMADLGVENWLILSYMYIYFMKKNNSFIMFVLYLNNSLLLFSPLNTGNGICASPLCVQL